MTPLWEEEMIYKDLFTHHWNAASPLLWNATTDQIISTTYSFRTGSEEYHTIQMKLYGKTGVSSQTWIEGSELSEKPLDVHRYQE